MSKVETSNSATDNKLEDQLKKQRVELAQERERLKIEAKNRLDEMQKEKKEKDKLTNNPSVPTVKLIRDHVMQRGMPSRPELMITMNFKQGQKVTDPELIQLLTQENAPVEHV